MDGVTDASFRRIVADQGKPDVTFTEFTHVHDICRGPEFLLHSLIYHDTERPIVAQLYGKDPDLFYQAAHAVCELGFDGLDINMGCPSRSVASSGSGAALIKTPELAHALLRAARQGIEDWAGGQSLEAAGIKGMRAAQIRALNRACSAASATRRRAIPLSVKTRLGYDTNVVERWVEHLLEERPAAISLHGRTLQQMYRGEADWSAIAMAAALVRGSGTRLLGNGDVHSMSEVIRRVQETGVDGVLVGRATLGAPWFFRDKERARRVCHAGETIPAGDGEAHVPLRQRFQVLLDHARQFETLCGRPQFHRMRKHLGWYCKGFPGAAALRAAMFKVSSVSELEATLAEYWPSDAEAVPSSDSPVASSLYESLA